MVKLMRQVPPSKKKEQFRDGVIWAHCLELLSEGDVYFISGDSDFFDNADFTKGLASELTLEMKSQSKKIQHISEANPCRSGGRNTDSF